MRIIEPNVQTTNEKIAADVARIVNAFCGGYSPERERRAARRLAANLEAVDRLERPAFEEEDPERFDGMA